MPVPRLPTLRVPREPLRARPKALSDAERVVRDAALAALRDAQSRSMAAEAAKLEAITRALEAHVTVAASAAVVGLTEGALSQRLDASRRRQERQ